MLKSIQNILIRKFGSVGQTISGSAPPSYEGPLDLVPSATWVGAWSTARAMSADMLGQNAYVVRRASDNTTTTAVYDAETGAVNESDISTFVNATTGFIPSLNDNSGNGKTQLQATEGIQPQWSADGAEHPGFNFSPDESTQCFLLTGANLAIASGGVTIFIVGKSTLPYNSSALLGINTSAGENQLTVTMNGGGGGVSIAGFFVDDVGGYYEVSGTQDITAALSDYFVLTIQLSNSVQKIKINGQQITATTSIAGTVSSAWAEPIALGNYESVDSGAPFIGLMKEWALTDGVLSDADVLSVTQDMATYYGITLP